MLADAEIVVLAVPTDRNYLTNDVGTVAKSDPVDWIIDRAAAIIRRAAR
ncbi:MAG: hypothetical protein HOQ24_10950 [Mycobacteriaceae bacterium]|nr:hypothetical protein [Mycobacteriaceae bacterium]